MIGTHQATIIVDVLGHANVWLIVMRYRRSRTVRYMHAARDPLSRIAVSLLRGWGWSVEPLAYTLAAVNGTSPFRDLNTLLMEAMRRFESQAIGQQVHAATILSSYERQRLLTCLRKHAAAELYLVFQLYVVLTSTQCVREPVHAILIRRSVFDAIIRDVYQRGQLQPQFYRGWMGRKIDVRHGHALDLFVIWKTKVRVERIAQACLLLVYSGYRWLGTMLRPRPPVKQHKICAIVVNNPPLDRCSCLPWIRTTDVALKQQVLGIYPPSVPDSSLGFYAARCDRLQPYNFANAFDRSQEHIADVWARYGPTFMRTVWRYRQLLGMNRQSRWVLKYLLEIMIKSSFFESLFRARGCRVLWTMNEDDAEGQLAALAMHNVGGVSFGTTWSQPPMPSWDIQRNQNDVYFVWGSRMVRIRQESDDTCYAFVETGYPADGDFEHASRQAKNLRSALRHRGVTATAVFYDARPANDTLMSPRLFVALYEELLAWLDEDPGHFLVLKTKRDDTLSWCTEIRERVARYCAADRIQIIPDRSTVYPGLTGDVVIGLGSSASLSALSAMLGRPTVFFDPNRIYRDYPMEGLYVTIISDASDLRHALNAATDAGRSIGYPEHLPTHTGSEIDRFADGRSALRIQSYIQDVMRVLDAGYAPSRAVEEANEQYQNTWGSGLVAYGSLMQMTTNVRQVEDAACLTT